MERERRRSDMILAVYFYKNTKIDEYLDNLSTTKYLRRLIFVSSSSTAASTTVGIFLLIFSEVDITKT